MLAVHDTYCTNLVVPSAFIRRATSALDSGLYRITTVSDPT